MLKKVRKVVPELLFRDGARLGRGCTFHQRVIVASYECSAPCPRGGRGAEPAEHRHEVVAPHSDPHRAHVRQEMTDLLDLLIATGQAKPDAVHWGTTFDHREGQARIREALLQMQERREVPHKRPPPALAGVTPTRHRLPPAGRPVATSRSVAAE